MFAKKLLKHNFTFLFHGVINMILLSTQFRRKKTALYEIRFLSSSG